MKIWPFGGNHDLETRDDSFTDTLIGALVSRAQGRTLALPTATAALESCAGVVGRGFMACEVNGRPALTDALTPSTLELIGRSLVRTGDLVLLIDVSGGVLRLLPVETHDVQGGPWPETWEYRVTLGGPSRTYTYDRVPAESVLHFRYARDAARPWRGNSPVAVAALSGKLSAQTVRQLGEEASGPVGAVLGIPKDGNDQTVDKLKDDIATAGGRVALLESGDWDNSGSAKVDLEAHRFGAAPPQSFVNLMDLATREIISACGLHPALFQVGPAAALREAWRLCLFSALSPLGRLVESELQAKLDGDVTLSWQELRASDLSGRARAFQSMVGGGLDVAKAVAIAGLMVDDG